MNSTCQFGLVVFSSNLFHCITAKITPDIEFQWSSHRETHIRYTSSVCRGMFGFIVTCIFRHSHYGTSNQVFGCFLKS
jgi:hypothetical protein